MIKRMNFVDGHFPIAQPEKVGISSRDIIAFLDALTAMSYELHSLEIVRYGKRVFAAGVAPYSLNDPHRLLSAAKGIIAAAVLFAIDDGKISFEDHIVDYFVDMLPDGQKAKFDKITVYDLMTMQTGQETDAPFLYFLEHPEEDLCQLFFTVVPDKEPGTHFFYNNSVPHLLFTLVQRATGCEFMDYIEEKICKPLDIHIMAERNKAGVYDPVTTVISPNDFMKLAVWFLQEGMWNGKQLLDPALVRTACTQQIFTEDENHDPNAQGYCMQLWRNAFGGSRMDGGGGQIALMLPEHDMAVIFTSNDWRGHDAIQLLYENIIVKLNGRELPDDPEGNRMLNKVAEHLTLAPKLATALLGCEQYEGDYCFFPNAIGVKTLSLKRRGKDYLLKFNTVHGDEDILIGTDCRWVLSDHHVLVQPDLSIQNRIMGNDPQQCYCAGGWRTQNEFCFTLKSLASMGEFRFILHFDGSMLQLNIPLGVTAGMKKEMGYTIASAKKVAADE